MPTVLITPEAFREKPAPYVDLLQAAGFDVRYPQNPIFTRGLCGETEAIDELSVCDAVIAGGEHYSATILSQLPKLRVVARCGVGFDRVDVPAATHRGIVVTITPTANHEAVAEQTLALMFAIAKSVVVYDRLTRGGRWAVGLTEPLRARTLGILGLGRIGRSLALRGAALGMRVIATETTPDAEFIAQHHIEVVAFDDLLARSDYLSIHCPLNDQTRGMFDRRVFAKMKPNSVFLNTARGKLVVEADLIDALQNGPLRAAGLDVFHEEPPSPDNPLFRLDNVVVSPHISGEDTLSSESMGVEAATCIVDLHQGRWPEIAVVNRELGRTWRW